MFSVFFTILAFLCTYTCFTNDAIIPYYIYLGRFPMSKKVKSIDGLMKYLRDTHHIAISGSS